MRGNKKKLRRATVLHWSAVFTFLAAASLYVWFWWFGEPVVEPMPEGMTKIVQSAIVRMVPVWQLYSTYLMLFISFVLMIAARLNDDDWK
jgi:hypothetical protein